MRPAEEVVNDFIRDTVVRAHVLTEHSEPDTIVLLLTAVLAAYKHMAPSSGVYPIAAFCREVTGFLTEAHELMIVKEERLH